MNFMKIRVNGFSTTLQIFAILYLLIGDNFLNLVALRSPLEICGVLAIVSFFIFLIIYNNKRRMIAKYNEIIKYVITTAILVIIISLISIIINNQTLSDVTKEGLPYYCVFLAAPLVYIMESKNGFKNILTIIYIVTLVSLILLLIQVNLYKISGILFLKTLPNNSILYLRSEFLRFSLPSMTTFVTFYSVFKVLTRKTNEIEKKKKLKLILHSCVIFLGVYCEVFIRQTRGSIPFYILSIYFMIVASKIYYRRYLNIFMVTIIGIFFLISSGLLDNYLISISSNSTLIGGADTINVRLDGIKYFWECFLKSPIWGNGFVWNMSGDLFSKVHGPYGIYFYTDVGIFGMLANMGIVGILLVFLFYMRLFNIVRFLRHKRAPESIYLIGVMTYFIMTSGSLLIFQSGRIVAVPFCLALFEYINNKYKSL